MIFKGFLTLLATLTLVSAPVIVCVLAQRDIDDTYFCDPEDDVPMDWVEFVEIMEGDDD